MRIYDISLPIAEGMPSFPGDPEVRVERVLDLARGDPYNLTRLTLGSHAGTHIDAPAHFLSGGKAAPELPLELFIGPAVVREVAGERVSAPALVGLELPTRTERLLLKTRNSELWNEPGFCSDFAYIDEGAAHWLVERGIRLVGIDYLSLEQYQAPEPRAHLVLLGAGVVILEGLDLRGVAPGYYTLVCLPLRVQVADGAPARAVLLGE